MDNLGQQFNCRACHAPGNGNFCSACGEPFKVKRITLKHMLHEAAHLITHFDKGFAYTIKQLILKPGYMQAEYLAGKRSLYQKPFSMFFVCGTITALALYWINRFIIAYHADGNLTETHFYQHYFVLLQMCLVPVYTLVACLFFGKRYNYAEYLVILLYNTSVLYLFITISNLLKLFFRNFKTGYVEIGFVFIYNVYTYLNLFTESNKVAIIVRTVLSSVVCFAVSRGAFELFIRLLMPHD